MFEYMGTIGFILNVWVSGQADIPVGGNICICLPYYWGHACSFENGKIELYDITQESDGYGNVTVFCGVAEGE